MSAKYDISVYIESRGEPLDRLEPEWRTSGARACARAVGESGEREQRWEQRVYDLRLTP